LEIRLEVVEWIQLAVSWVQWQAVVNIGIIIQFHKMPAISGQSNAGYEISGLNPVARSESLAAIFSRTDLIKGKKWKIYQYRYKIYQRQPK
jgi:hypothetical protein